MKLRPRNLSKLSERIPHFAHRNYFYQFVHYQLQILEGSLAFEESCHFLCNKALVTLDTLFTRRAKSRDTTTSSTSDMHRLVLVLLFFLAVVAADCPNNCSHKGECVDNACVCVNLHEGEDCSLEWRFLHKGWKEFFGFYVYVNPTTLFSDCRTLGVLLMLSCVVFTIILIVQDFLSNQSSGCHKLFH